MKKNLPAVSHQKFLIQSLRCPEEASAYLNAALENGDRRAFCLALKNVLDAARSMRERHKIDYAKEILELILSIDPKQDGVRHILEELK